MGGEPAPVGGDPAPSGGEPAPVGGEPEGAPAQDVGQPCDADADCDEVCFVAPDFPGGYCSASCAELDCAEGDECFTFGDDEADAWCLKTCADDAECRVDAGYVCDVDETCYPDDEAGPVEPPACTDDNEPNESEGTATLAGDLGAECAAPRLALAGTATAGDEDWLRAGGVGSDRCPMFSLEFSVPADAGEPLVEPALTACVFGRCADGSEPEFTGCFLPQEESPEGLFGCCSEIPNPVGAPWLEIHCGEVAVEYFMRVTTTLPACVPWEATAGPQQF
jgi:hypothetical protein